MEKLGFVTVKLVTSVRERWLLVVLVIKNLLANAGDAREVVSIPGLGRSPREEMAPNSSILAWRVTVHGATKSRA